MTRRRLFAFLPAAFMGPAEDPREWRITTEQTDGISYREVDAKNRFRFLTQVDEVNQEQIVRLWQNGKIKEAVRLLPE